MRNYIEALFKNAIIGLLPTTYYLIAIFILTITGIHVMYTIVFIKVLGVLFSIQIITIEFALVSYLYKDRKERLVMFTINTIIFIIGLTIFS